ncbi:ubiquitin-like-conjugating enzyme ATG10-like protein [Cricetulus griseus]|nr:ubiquitin-like-conjugating enzyme ATG10-like protein [Cricetulus griseus]
MGVGVERYLDCSDGYMCKTQFQIKNGTTTSHRGTPASVHTCLPTEENLELTVDDSEVMESAAASQVIKYEYHVVYSCSYQVPVLYFRASFLDGRPLALKDIWEGVHECYKTRLLQGPWDTITQQERLHIHVIHVLPKFEISYSQGKLIALPNVDTKPCALVNCMDLKICLLKVTSLFSHLPLILFHHSFVFVESA